jgi:hypothetical protein
MLFSARFRLRRPPPYSSRIILIHRKRKQDCAPHVRSKFCPHQPLCRSMISCLAGPIRHNYKDHSQHRRDEEDFRRRHRGSLRRPPLKASWGLRGIEIESWRAEEHNRSLQSLLPQGYGRQAICRLKEPCQEYHVLATLGEEIDENGAQWRWRG